MKLDPDGAQLCQTAFTPAEVDSLEIVLATIPTGRPGTRLGSVPGLADAVRPATAVATSILGRETRPVRATLFDKSPERNWSLGWHQDRTIAVRAGSKRPASPNGR
jgi:hypothetical protein